MCYNKTKKCGEGELVKKRTLLRLGRDALIMLLILALTVLACFLLGHFFDDSTPFAVPVFVLGVALIARFTTSYFWGILASLVSVVCANYIFTYPYWEFNMTISGYPLTFAVMLVVALIISTLTTQSKRAEQLRFEAETEKMRANLLRSVSHDLRTPLASILGASSTLLENRDLAPAERDELLREINKDARWLERVTENILSVTKFSGGDVRLKKTEEVVEEIVGSAIVAFRKNHPQLPVTVQKPREILLVPMDATLIGQVLVNLFENVVDHAETATHIAVRIERGEGRVCFSVTDDGVGIAKEALAHLFDGRAASAAKPCPDDRRNMGIGLSVCNSIIRAHGGAMEARNNEAGGATFSFWLPCEEED